MGLKAKERKAERRKLTLYRRLRLHIDTASLKELLGTVAREVDVPGRSPWRVARRPMRHVYKFREPSFKGEPWFFRKKSQKED